MPEEHFYEPAVCLNFFEAGRDTGEKRVGLQEITVVCSKAVMNSFQPLELSVMQTLQSYQARQLQ